jgi:hypothetical protein
MIDDRMKSEQAIVIGVAAVAVAIAAYFIASKPRETEITPDMLTIGIDRPIIWVYYDDSQVNSRFWSDFGARSSRVINIPILNLCYESIVKANPDYRVEVIGGLQGVSELLGVDAMPKTMKNPRANVGTAQLDWIRTAILAKYGGLWLSNSVVCVKGFGTLPDNVVAFGQDDVPMYGSAVPGFRALWSPKAGEPRFVEWEAICRERLDSQLGGLQIRGDSKSDWVRLFKGEEVRRSDELSRDSKTQKKLELEDLFATQGGVLTIPCDAKYIVIPYDDLVNRRMFGWILRNSEQQILESDIAISRVLRKIIADP